MGDRANFGIQSDGTVIYVYGHWAGHDMLARFANALDRVATAGRVKDHAYATRIIISDLIGDDWSQDLSWGITVNYIGDNEHKVPVYDIATDTVSLYDWDWKSGQGVVLTDKLFDMDREKFVAKYSKTLIGA